MGDYRQQAELAEMLQEPAVKLVMARDGVTAEDVEDLIARVGARYAALTSPDSEPR